MATDDEKMEAVVKGMWDGTVLAAEPHLADEGYEPDWRLAHWDDLTDRQRGLFIDSLHKTSSTILTTARKVALLNDREARDG